jgi:hypothetical protein
MYMTGLTGLSVNDHLLAGDLVRGIKPLVTEREGIMD